MELMVQILPTIGMILFGINMNKQQGFTLVEVILYVAILGFISTALMTMSINMMSLKTKSVSEQELDSNLQFISQKINFEIRNAKSISATTTSSLTLISADNSRNPTIFDLNNGNIRIGFGVGGSCPAASPCILNNNVVHFSGFSVTNLSSGTSQTENVLYTLTGNYINTSGRSEFNASGSITDSIEVRSR